MSFFFRMKRTSVLLLAFFCGLLFSCSSPSRYITHEGFTQGTTYKIIYDSPGGINYEEDIQLLLNQFSASLSTYIPTSLISRINRNDSSAVVDQYFRTVFDKAAEVTKASGGVFDITIAPIVNLWGFGFTSDFPEIDPTKIDSLLQFVGMDKVRISGDKVIKDSPGVMLDVNAIAKGYSVDVVGDFLKEKGCVNYLVDIGGEAVARGVNDTGYTWRVGIDRPADHALPGAALQAIIRLNNRALATSGNYRRFFEIDGVKYAHSIDVKTGYPVRNNLLSATILASDCITADAWATVCMVSGLNKSIEILRQHPELDGFLIYNEDGIDRVFITDGLQDVINAR